MRPGRVVIGVTAMLLAVSGALRCSRGSTSPHLGVVTGRVLAMNGQPIAGALVRAQSAAGALTVVTDGGVVGDGGVPPPDGGVPPPDGGVPPPDGGVPPLDGGVVSPDGGTAPPDGGVVAADGGTPVPDGGSATCDADGNFALYAPPAPYDLDVVMPSGTHGIRYVGLSNPSPILIAVGEAAGPSYTYTATISGSVDGGAVSPAGGAPPGTVSWITYGSPGGYAVGVAPLAPTGGPYSLGVSWQGAASIDGGVAAIQYQLDGGAPATYFGYGERTGVSVADGGVVSGADVTLGPVSQGSVAGTFLVPDSSYLISAKALSLTLPNSAQVPLGADRSATSGFSFLLPAIDGGVAAVSATAGQTGGGTAFAVQYYSLPPAVDGGTIQISAAPGQTAPADGSAGVTRATPLSWTGCAGVALVEITCSTATVQVFHVLTGASSVTLPDFGAGGLPPPASAPCTWAVQCLPFLPDVDAATVPGAYPTEATVAQPNTGYQISRSATWSFTTSATP